MEWGGGSFGDGSTRSQGDEPGPVARSIEQSFAPIIDAFTRVADRISAAAVRMNGGSTMVPHNVDK
jgi:hypothetical protein